VLRLGRYGCHVWGMRLSRLGAWCGVMGPVLFTAAWVVSSLRQAGHSASEVQLSGLAADDARDPQIMMAGFVVLGVCSIAFGIALRRALAPRAARKLIGNRESGIGNRRAVAGILDDTEAAG